MREYLLVLGVTGLTGLMGCGDGVDLDLDLSFGGPVVGGAGKATFHAVDGCPGYDLFGCPDTLPTFAVGAHARFIIGSTTGDASDEEAIALARPRSVDETIVEVGRGADGLLLLDAVSPGRTSVNLYTGEEFVDSIEVEVEDIQQLEVVPSDAVYLTGTPFAVRVKAYGASRGGPLYARGAVSATTFDGLALEEHVGYFDESDQFAVRGTSVGVGRFRVDAGATTNEITVRTVARNEITEIVIHELAPAPDANKIRLFAHAKVNDLTVNGGPACDWRIVSGGGPGAALSSSVDDPFSSALFVIDDGAIAFGSGDMVVECRTNDQVFAEHTIHFAP